MKFAIALFLLLACSALAQDNSALAKAEAACGPTDTRFDAHTKSGEPIAEIEPGKALVYVTEVFEKVPGELGNPTLRVGSDGQWVGATRSNSYIAFSVEPGEHHLCSNWQSRLKTLSRKAAFTSFNAEAGKTYYFRARISYNSTFRATTMSLDLEPVNPDEGKFLVTSNSASVSQKK